MLGQIFAVHFENLKWQQDPNDHDELVMFLNGTQKQLEGQTGFDEDHWPNFADRKVTARLDGRHGFERQMPNRDGYRKTEENGTDVDVDDEPNRDNE